MGSISVNSIERRLKAVEKASAQRGNDAARMRQFSERLARARERSGLPEQRSIWEDDPPPAGLNLAELLDLARHRHRERDAKEWQE